MQQQNQQPLMQKHQPTNQPRRYDIIGVVEGLDLVIVVILCYSIVVAVSIVVDMR